MKIWQVALLVAMFALSLFEGHAQTRARNSLSAGWGVSLPAGGGNFRSEACYIFPSVEWEYRISTHFSAGAFVGYARSEEEGRTQERIDGDLVNGSSTRTLSLLPLQARLHYFPLGGKSTALRPYLSVSGGAQYADFKLTGETISTSGTKNWAGLFAAGAGVRYYPCRKSGLFLDLGAAWQWAGNRFERMGTRAQRSIELRLGIGITI